MQKLLFSLLLVLLAAPTFAQKPFFQAGYVGPGLGAGNAPCGVPVSYTLTSVAQPGGSSNLQTTQDAIRCIFNALKNDPNAIVVENGYLLDFSPYDGTITIVWDCLPCPLNTTHNVGAFSSGGVELNCNAFVLLIEESVRVACTLPTSGGNCKTRECLRVNCDQCGIVQVRFSNGTSQQYTITTPRTFCFAEGLQVVDYTVLPCQGRAYSSERSEILQEGDGEQVSLKVYPNPASNLLNVEFNHDETDQPVIAVFNSVGAKVLETAMQQQNQTLDLSHFPSGIYILKAEAGKRSFHTKVVLQH